MTQREILIEDMQGMETVLCQMGKEEQRKGGAVYFDPRWVKACATTLWHILTWIIKRIDEERRNK